MTSTSRRRIRGDRWDGPLNHDWTIEDASPADFERALEQLDGRSRTMLTVEGDGQRHLTVGGGAGRYVVYISFDNDDFWNLLCPIPQAGIVLLNAGGQEGDYPAKQIVDLAQARAAGRAFFDHQGLDPAQQWEKQ